MRKTKEESLFEGLAEFVKSKFFYNPLMKITSHGSDHIWKNICNECGSTEPRFSRHYDIKETSDFKGKARYLSLKTQPCTPLQAYLLEFNFGYRRLK